jgi:hypothetical protein
VRTDWPFPRVAEVLAQHGFDVFEVNPTTCQLLAIPVLAEERLAAKKLRSLDDRLMEGQVLESVQCVVVNENWDRPLRREQVRCVIDDLGQSREGIGIFARHGRGPRVYESAEQQIGSLT